jgi:non-heme chloroperoxidase
MTDKPVSMTELELAQTWNANATEESTPVVFVHGLWLLPSSWDGWGKLFEEAGFTPLTPGWPGDPETIEEAAAHPEVFADKTIGAVADHFEEIIRNLDRKPVLIGHSIGGLLAQILAGRGLARATVAIDPAPFRGVVSLPVSSVMTALPVLSNLANLHRAVPLTFEQFRYAFANAVSEAEAHQLFEALVVPASGAPLFQMATANINPWTEVQVDTHNPERGPLLFISGENNQTVPWSLISAEFHLQEQNEGITELVEMKGRGHSLIIDSGWQQVAETALAFAKRFAA